MITKKIKLYMRSNKANYNAFAIYDNGIITVLKGSIIRNKNENYKRPQQFEDIRNNEKLVKDCLLLENIVFSSPSTAASFVAETSRNGLLYWRDENNIKLKELLNGGKNNE